MASVIQVERDMEGLQEAIRALFEESFQLSAIGVAVRSADKETRQRALADMDQRKLSPGYYTRATYLLDLGSALEAGVSYGADQLTRSDVLGLQALNRAKNEFYNDHPACSACGVRKDNRFASQCKGCHAQFGRGDN